ncbi:MAG: peroxide stress protein YaaA [Corynebacterium sp.]|uniref:peroxide stress protein YaaA n=1 Tax=Corynebacterium sp. TaxID=1720 RepID=UPI0026E0862F|nr:peroxide stress protein YaaA [Corynebacterium sp.]MDO5670957.1 peroxide stress protein YaaA [Corynebacterium sp.]
MLIVLPPSETKAPGGSGPALDLEGLSFPALNPTRSSLIDVLSALEVDEALPVLKISEKLRPEAEANLALRTSPTTPALHRYTGVLFDALSAPTLPDIAWERLAVGSALFGVVRAGDLIPRYRLSGGTKLDGRTMRSRWGRLITEALAEEGFVVDLRSGAYQQLGRVPGAVTVRVEKDGKVVSHFNKHYKGELARVLASAPVEAASTGDVVDIARAAGLTVSPTSATELTLTV